MYRVTSAACLAHFPSSQAYRLLNQAHSRIKVGPTSTIVLFCFVGTHRELRRTITALLWAIYYKTFISRIHLLWSSIYFFYKGVLAEKTSAYSASSSLIPLCMARHVQTQVIIGTTLVDPHWLSILRGRSLFAPRSEPLFIVLQQSWRLLLIYPQKRSLSIMLHKAGAYFTWPRNRSLVSIMVFEADLYRAPRGGCLLLILCKEDVVFLEVGVYLSRSKADPYLLLYHARGMVISYALQVGCLPLIDISCSVGHTSKREDTMSFTYAYMLRDTDPSYGFGL